MLTRFTKWHSRHAFLTLNGALGAYLSANPIAVLFGIGDRTLGAVLIVALISATSATSNRRSGKWMRALTFVAVVALGVSALIPSQVAAYPAHLSGIALLGWCTVSIFRHVIRAAVVDSERMHAAVSVYLLLGTMFSLLYLALEESIPGSFKIPHRGSGLREVMTYFSYVTLTTVGFGDVSPAHPIARSLAIVEALTGQLYLTILVARLVGLSTAARGAGPSTR